MKDTNSFNDKIKEQLGSSFRTAGAAQRYFSRKQNSLKLDEFLLPEKLSSKDFRSDGFARLDELEKLLKEHRQFYANFVVSNAKGVFEILAEEDESAIKNAIEASASKMEKKMYEQALFFNARQKWIKSTRMLLTILEEGDDVVFFDGEIFQFCDDPVFEKFEECLRSMDEAAEIERLHIESKRFSFAAGCRNLFGFIK